MCDCATYCTLWLSSKFQDFWRKSDDSNLQSAPFRTILNWMKFVAPQAKLMMRTAKNEIQQNPQLLYRVLFALTRIMDIKPTGHEMDCPQTCPAMSGMYTAYWVEGDILVSFALNREEYRGISNQQVKDEDSQAIRIYRRGTLKTVICSLNPSLVFIVAFHRIIADAGPILFTSKCDLMTLKSSNDWLIIFHLNLTQNFTITNLEHGNRQVRKGDSRRMIAWQENICSEQSNTTSFLYAVAVFNPISIPAIVIPWLCTHSLHCTSPTLSLSPK
jgi:hypothetical protein